MSSSDATIRVEPLSAPAVINPGPDAQPPLNLADDANRRKQKAPTPTERLEARADRHIEELRDDKKKLEDEIGRLRNEEMPRLHSRIEEAESKLTQQYAAMARLETSYGWAISFDLFSFALVGIGSALISYAAFVDPWWPLDKRFVADVGITSLVVGIVLKAWASYQSKKSLLGQHQTSPAMSRKGGSALYGQNADEKT